MNPTVVLSRALLACLCLAAAALAGAAGPEPAATASAPGTVTIVASQSTTPPYRLKEVIDTERVLRDGNVISRKRFIVSVRDRAGNSRREELNEHRVSETIVIALAQGVRYTLDPAAKTATQTAVYNIRPVISSVPAPQARPPETTTIVSADMAAVPAAAQEIRVRITEATPNPQLARIAVDAFADRKPTRVTVHTPLGNRVINGERCTGTLISYDIAAGEQGNQKAMTITTETWMSDELKIPLFTKTTDPRYGTTTTSAIELVRGEPDPSEFTVPSDYALIDKARPAAM